PWPRSACCCATRNTRGTPPTTPSWKSPSRPKAKTPAVTGRSSSNWCSGPRRGENKHGELGGGGSSGRGECSRTIVLVCKWSGLAEGARLCNDGISLWEAHLCLNLHL